MDENDNVEKGASEYSVSRSTGVGFQRSAEMGPVVAQPKKFQGAATHAEEAVENISIEKKKKKKKKKKRKSVVGTQ